MKSFIILLFLAAQSYYVSSEVVECGLEQDEVCECSKGEDVCEFVQLRVDELQTFTSYKIEGEPGSINTNRGLAGSNYYMDAQGFQQLLSQEERILRGAVLIPLVLSHL